MSWGSAAVAIRIGRSADRQIGRLLRNPIYAGIIRGEGWGVEARGDFVRIVSESVFYRVQTVLDGRGVPKAEHRREHPDFPLRRFVRCHTCGGGLTASWSKGRAARYGYYRCAGCGAVNVRRERVEEAFRALLEPVRVAPEYLRLFQAIVTDAWKKRGAEAAEGQKVWAAHVEKIKRRKAQLVEAFVYQQSIDAETYRGQLDRIEDELAFASADAIDGDLEIADLEGTLAFAEHVIGDPARAWAEFNTDQRRRFQRLVFPEGIAWGPSDGIGTAVPLPCSSTYGRFKP